MSMTPTQKNIATDLRAKCTAALVLNDNLPAFLALWTSEGMASLTDADWAELPEFAGVTAAEAVAARAGLNTLFTTMGQYGAGTPSLYMIRLCNQVPNG